MESKLLYPKLPRSQHRGAKLSDLGIETIQQLHKDGWGYKRIAVHMGVDKVTARYWCMTPEERKERNRKRYNKHGGGVTSEYMVELRRRKIELGLPIKEYEAMITRNHRKLLRCVYGSCMRMSNNRLGLCLAHLRMKNKVYKGIKGVNA